MLKTIEAVYDPAQGLKFSEPVVFNKPVRVLVTVLETPPDSPETPAETGANLLRNLESIHRIPIDPSSRRSPEEQEAYILENRSNWD
jgi:hypothetical protein